MATMDENLQDVYAEESMAHINYLAFAAKADEEGQPEAARAFRAAAAGERAHALLVLNKMGISDTDGNIERAEATEREEAERKYLEMEERAGKEGDDLAQSIFGWIRAVEAEHAELFRMVESDQEPNEEQYWVCEACGHIEFGEAPETCPICGANKEAFRLVS